MRHALMAAGLAMAALGAGCATAGAPTAPEQRLALSQCRPDGFPEDVLCGVFTVPENRAIANGRTLPLRVIVLPARERTDEGAIFFLSGGPGQAATKSAQYLVGSAMQARHDIVFIDVRGTGEGHRLDCNSSVSDANLQAIWSR